jgi:O-antigen/teichoic acid export membrane protein
VLLLSGYYGPGFLGVYAVAERVLRAPASLLAQASSQVLFTRMTESRVQARMNRVLLRWSLGVAVVCVVPFLLLHFLGEPIFGFVLGEQWRASARWRRGWPRLASRPSSPPSTLLVVANREPAGLMQVLFCAGGFGAL